MLKQVLPQFEFFERLSESYDQMISWPTRLGIESSFFKTLINDYKLRSYLDVACSTGFHVILLRRMGVDAVGIDASPKMIAKARSNALACGVNVECILGDMNRLSKRFSEGFDIVSCLGNTIAHLKNKNVIKNILDEIYKCLNPGGLFVIQIHNYDHIVKNKIRFLPPSGNRNDGEETVFFRMLDFNPKSIDLSVVKHYRHENNWELTVHSTQIYPHYKKDLENLLKLVGFNKFHCYRNFNFEDYDTTGKDLLIVAQKQGALKPRTPRRTISRTLNPSNRTLLKTQIHSQTLRQPRSKARVISPDQTNTTSKSLTKSSSYKSTPVKTRQPVGTPSRTTKKSPEKKTIASRPTQIKVIGRKKKKLSENNKKTSKTRMPLSSSTSAKKARSTKSSKRLK